ncbi:helix-turn-helix transcriptional regulator [Enterococcus sp. BWM-S5]|uniref:Helix-turn-helix transcriptional regulator n=1 Tax=Enterococcus larvae TaxID=2794352 RepID=A0ABS4CR33_9ENTE|nr:AraC family transcriptional regulator [Enterococcus larvae]MBP1048472.1 helix-turn-helix transcriptional regulator [Enterococcus larvae]
MKHEKIIPSKKYPFKIFEFHSTDTEKLILPHWHSSLELLFCLDGLLEIRYPQSTYQVRKNELFLINSNIIHSTKTPEPSQVFVIQLPLSFIKKITEDTYAQSIYFEKNLSESLGSTKLIKEIRRIYLQDTIASRALVISKIYTLFSILLDSFTVPTVEVKEIRSVKNLDLLGQINQFIEENHTRNLTLEEVATTFNYNTSYFSRYYKQFMGITFIEYLKSVRLDKAYSLLRDTDLTILSISNECGFGNVKSFYLAFKEEYQLSPKQYRQKHLK